jgi:hypothetical protein
MISPERRRHLLSGKSIGHDRPVYLPAWLACELQTDEGRYNLVHWWGDNLELPAGFTRFIWVHGLNVMFMNAQDTAFDVAGTLDRDNVIFMFGVDVPPDYHDECVFPPIWTGDEPE